MALFEKGKSGNPAGRPRRTGTPDELRRAIEARAVEIINRLIDAALDGDTQAARTLLDRILPAWKAQERPVTLPEGVPLSDLASAPQAVLQALSDGRITTDTAAELSAVLAGLARVVEVAELAARVSALESRQ